MTFTIYCECSNHVIDDYTSVCSCNGAKTVTYPKLDLLTMNVDGRGWPAQGPECVSYGAQREAVRHETVQSVSAC